MNFVIVFPFPFPHLVRLLRFWVFTLLFSCGSVLGQFLATATLSGDGSWLGCDWWHFKLSSSCLGEQLLRRGGSSLFLLLRCRASSFSCFSSIHVVAPSPPTHSHLYYLWTIYNTSWPLFPFGSIFLAKNLHQTTCYLFIWPPSFWSILTKSPWARCAVGV